MFILVALMLGAPLVESVVLLLLTYSIVSAPLPTSDPGAFSLGLHPIIGIMLGLIVAYRVWTAYQSRLFSILIGVVFTLAWAIIGFSFENGGAVLGQELLHHGGHVSHLATQFPHPKWTMTFLLTVGSIFWRYALHAMVGTGTRRAPPRPWTRARLKDTVMAYAYLAVFSALIWIASMAL